MRKLRITLLFGLFILCTPFLFAQETFRSWEEKLILNGDDIKKEVLLDVGPDANEVSISISGKVAEGDFKVKLMNPRGITVSNLNLCAGKNSTAKGRLTEVVDATTGIWKLKISNKDAEGKMNIELKQN